jgi:hypothetical protein
MGPVELVDEKERPLRLTPGRLLLGAIVLASFGVWVYAFSGLAHRPTPDRLDDDTFAARAEPRCAVALGELGSLEPAWAATDNVDRSLTIVEANGILTAMVADLRPLVTGSERDRQILDAWLTDWETWLRDRADYAIRLADDAGARFYQSDVANELLDRRLTRLAEINGMPSCAAPGDVG